MSVGRAEFGHWVSVWEPGFLSLLTFFCQAVCQATNSHPWGVRLGSGKK